MDELTTSIPWVYQKQAQQSRVHNLLDTLCLLYCVRIRMMGID